MIRHDMPQRSPGDVLEAAPICANCANRSNEGACLLDVQDPRGHEIDTSATQNWRNRDTFSCAEWARRAVRGGSPQPRLAGSFASGRKSTKSGGRKSLPLTQADVDPADFG